jgi:DNA adenine methylase
MKYMGSKRRVAKYIAPIIQAHIDSGQYKTYIEPFVGGANMIEHIECENRHGSDIHPNLIALLVKLQDGWCPPESISNEKYNHVRKNPDMYLPSFSGFVGFCCSYSGKWWGGYARGNDNNGNPRNYCDEARRNLLKQAPKIESVEFRYHSYSNYAPENCVVYCDPPYAKTTKYKTFDFNHSKFWDWCEKYARPEYNNTILVSEYFCPREHKVLWEKEISSSLTQDTGSKKATEKLFWVR